MFVTTAKHKYTEIKNTQDTGRTTVTGYITNLSTQFTLKCLPVN